MQGGLQSDSLSPVLYVQCTPCERLSVFYVYNDVTFKNIHNVLTPFSLSSCEVTVDEGIVWF